jgi:hypothetical protein
MKSGHCCGTVSELLGIMTVDTVRCQYAAKRCMAGSAVLNMIMVATEMTWRPKCFRVMKGSPGNPTTQTHNDQNSHSIGMAGQWMESHTI